MKTNTPLIPDFGKKKFQIIITVCENCQTIEVNAFNKNEPATFHEIIGALEVQKSIYLYDQSCHNRKEYRKQLKNSNK
jgi:hypothetical protein